ncbi:hypothetical protein F4802DRAFT_275941 [Xylaria palmicola]|nr:hypothetical protein F4802DRAFT_275941 [Xylaria palmicola]
MSPLLGYRGSRLGSLDIPILSSVGGPGQADGPVVVVVVVVVVVFLLPSIAAVALIAAITCIYPSLTCRLADSRLTTACRLVRTPDQHDPEWPDGLPCSATSYWTDLGAASSSAPQPSAKPPFHCPFRTTRSTGRPICSSIRSLFSTRSAFSLHPLPEARLLAVALLIQYHHTPASSDVSICPPGFSYNTWAIPAYRDLEFGLLPITSVPLN